MPSHYCPHCNERYTVGFDVTDFVHQCSSGNPAIDQEDVVITGNWKDFSGEGTRNPQEVLKAGAHNELFPTIMQKLKDSNGEDILVFAGGIILFMKVLTKEKSILN